MEEKGRPGNSCGLTDIAHCRRGITLRGKESYRAIVDVAAGPLALADRAAGRFLDDTHCHVITLSQPISRHPSNSYGNGSFEEMKKLIKVGSAMRSEEHTSELQSLMRISYAVFCLKKKKTQKKLNQK